MGTNLRYIPIKDILLVPDDLLNQIDEFNASRLKRYADGIEANPYNIMGVFVDRKDENNPIKGFIWSSFNPVNDIMNVHALVVDKKYRGNGIVGEAKNIMDRECKRLGAEKYRFQTKTPDIFERWGFKRTNIIVMEG